MAKTEKRSRLKTLTFIVGGIIGAIGGLLFAPRPGKDTREQLRQRAEEMMEDCRERYGDKCGSVRDMAAGRGEGIKERIEEARGKIMAGVESATQAVKDKIGAGEEISKDSENSEEKNETQTESQ